MKTISIELDDRVADGLATFVRAHGMTVEEWLRAEAERVAQPLPNDDVPNGSHRTILAALDRPEGYYGSSREEWHDRERDRAQAYAAARKDLLDLIENTQADMGVQKWNRSSLYAP